MLKNLIRLLALFIAYWSKDIQPSGRMPEVLLTSGKKINKGSGSQYDFINFGKTRTLFLLKHHNHTRFGVQKGILNETQY